MRVAFIGASALARAATELFLRNGHEVVIVDKDQSVIDTLSEELDCSFMHGDGSRPHIFEDLDPTHTDCLFCVSSDDTANILGAVVAQSMEFDRVVVRIEDHSLLPICETLKLDNVIVPDRRVSEELMAFAEGKTEALSSEAK